MKQELVQWVNGCRIPTYIGPRKEIPKGAKVQEYKQSVHLGIINSDGKFLLQQRSWNKKHFPGCWSFTGGGIHHNESSIEAVERECQEELGIPVQIDNLELKLSFQREFDYVDVYCLHQDIDLESLSLQSEEVIQAAYFSKEEIEEMIIRGSVAPSVAAYFAMFCLCISKDFDHSYTRLKKRQ